MAVWAHDEELEVADGGVAQVPVPAVHRRQGAPGGIPLGWWGPEPGTGPSGKQVATRGGGWRGMRPAVEGKEFGWRNPTLPSFA